MSKSAVMTIRDVAHESGYSASTVSIVLNNAPLSRYIPADTKQRIETAARRLGYRPNPLARSLTSTDPPRRRWLILAAVPLLIDFSLTYFGVWSNTHLTRFSTGALLGAVAVFYVIPGLVELSSTIMQRFARN